MLGIDVVYVVCLNTNGEFSDGNPAYRALAGQEQSYPTLGKGYQREPDTKAEKFVKVYFDAGNPGGTGGHFSGLRGVSGAHNGPLPDPKTMARNLVAQLRLIIASTASSESPVIIPKELLQGLESLSRLEIVERDLAALLKQMRSSAKPIEIQDDEEEEAAALRDFERAQRRLEEVRATKAAATSASDAPRAPPPPDPNVTGDEEGPGHVGGANPADDELLTQVMRAVETVVRADTCDDLTFSSVFQLSDDASPVGKEGDSRSDAIVLALPCIQTEITAIIAKPTRSGERTKAAKRVLKRLHQQLNGIPVNGQLALLRAYNPILMPLLPAKYDFYSELSLKDVGVLDTNAAKEIAELAMSA